MKTLRSIAVSKKRGFGLIETLIAVSVLALVLGVSVMLGTVMLRNTALATQMVQATNLAREQLEEVRGIRDTIWINPEYSSCAAQWDCWVKASAGLSDRNTSVNSIIPDGGSQDFVLKKDDSGDSYLESGDPAPRVLLFADSGGVKYREKITIKAIDSSLISPFSVEGESATVKLSEAESGINGHGKKIYQINSTVEWDSYGRENSVTLNTYLSDWLPRF